MKKFAVLAVLAIGLMVAGSAIACTDYWCQPPKSPVGAGEAQTFVNQSVEANQGFVTQKVEECGFHYTVDKTETATVKAYGSIHAAPGKLFFGEATITHSFSSDVGNVFRKIDAQLDEMQSNVKMAADAGSSVDFNNAVVGASSSGTQNFAQTQTLSGLHVGCGGILGGTQTYNGTTTVNTFAHN